MIRSWRMPDSLMIARQLGRLNNGPEIAVGPMQGRLFRKRFTRPGSNVMSMAQACPKCGNFVYPQGNVPPGNLRCDRCGTLVPAAGGSFAAGSQPQPPPGYSAPYIPQFPPAHPPAYPQPYVNPYQTPNVFADGGYPGYPPGYMWQPDRARALAKVQGPGILLQVYGVLLCLSAIGMVALIPVALQSDNEDDRTILPVVFAVAALIALVSGGFTIWCGIWLKTLRNYVLVVTCVILTSIVGFLICIPAVLVGIWPLIALNDAEVKACFDKLPTQQ